VLSTRLELQVFASIVGCEIEEKKLVLTSVVKKIIEVQYFAGAN